MVVLILEDARPALRGLLSRWLIEPRAGVFVGRLSARVRDRLWKRVVTSGKVQGALLVAYVKEPNALQPIVVHDNVPGGAGWVARLEE